MPDERIYKATVVIDGKRRWDVDVVRYADQWWIVPEWWPDAREGRWRPILAISLETIRYQGPRVGDASPQFFLTDPLPRSIFEGRLDPKVSGDYITAHWSAISFAREAEPSKR